MPAPDSFDIVELVRALAEAVEQLALRVTALEAERTTEAKAAKIKKIAA